ncbi:tRNA 2-thiouridine(34) synthase MnmA [Candidatus Kaiserbacteria bacterium]|nr:tRNA 2-thiouridine(34) synthase MnmA [Candidatus Kaiserbacteria bacterium]
MKNEKETVFVGLSGGVDSSVAALRLLKQGYFVVGVFIKVWQPDWLKCNWEEERLDAMRVAAKLKIPFLTCDSEQAYKQEVADYFINEYKQGRTPNPDVMCNKYVKFGSFLDFAKKHGADYVATGHYARKIPFETKVGSYLGRGADNNKDQSYFLWTLTKDQIEKILLPVGDSTKAEIRQEAKKAGLLTSDKKDSQGVCFLGHIDIAEFLSHYIDLKTGDVLNEAGAKIGQHKGAIIYTTGQRHGFEVFNKEADSEPQYVINRDIISNTITVSNQKPTLERKNIRLNDCSWVNEPPKVGQEYYIQTRYRQTPVLATVESTIDNQVKLKVDNTTDEPTAGQSCVLYNDHICIGGGIIS